MAPNVASMVQRIELNHALTSEQEIKEFLRRQPATTVDLPFRPKLPKPNDPKEDLNNQMLETKSKHLSTTIKVEPESSDELEASQAPDHHHHVKWPSGDSEPYASAHQTSPFTVCTSACRRNSVKIKKECAPPVLGMIETTRQSTSATTSKLGCPVRLPSLLAEKYYQSVMIKTEDEEITSTKTKPSHLTQDCDNPTSFVKLEKTSPTSPPISHGCLNNIRPKVERRSTPYPRTPTKPISPPCPKCGTSPGPPTSLHPAYRSDTLFSYLKPVTPTPFAATSSVPNPHPFAPKIHCVPGSILEERKRPTKWPCKLKSRRVVRRSPPLKRTLPAGKTDGYQSADVLLQGEGEGKGRKPNKRCEWMRRPLKYCQRKLGAEYVARKSRKAVKPGLLRKGPQKMAAARLTSDVWWKEGGMAPATTAALTKETKKTKWWSFGRRNHTSTSSLRSKKTMRAETKIW